MNNILLAIYLPFMWLLYAGICMNLEISLVRLSEFRCRIGFNTKDIQHILHCVTNMVSCDRINTVELNI
jgi:hypothetical protein